MVHFYVSTDTSFLHFSLKLTRNSLPCNTQGCIVSCNNDKNFIPVRLFLIKAAHDSVLPCWLNLHNSSP